MRVSADTIARRLRDTAFLTAGLVLHLDDERTDRSADTAEPVAPLRADDGPDTDGGSGPPARQTFHAPDGLRDFVDHIRATRGRDGLHDIIHLEAEEQGPPGRRFRDAGGRTAIRVRNS